jgi:hypothetical protein
MRSSSPLRIAREIGLRDAEMFYLSNLGGACLHLGDLEAAEKHLTQVIKLAKSVGFGQLSETYRFLATTQTARFNPGAGLRSALKAITLAKEVVSPEFLSAVGGR